MSAPVAASEKAPEFRGAGKKIARHGGVHQGKVVLVNRHHKIQAVTLNRQLA
jgi:hypothetical protein